MSRLLASASLATLAFCAVPALADDAAVLKQLERMQQRLDAQEQSIAEQKAEIAKLKAQLAGSKAEPAASTAAAAPPASVSELSETVTRQQAQIDALETQQKQTKIRAAEAPSFTLSNGRPNFTTASGNFSVALRSLVQLDAGYYNQDATAPAGFNDLSSGTNFRRARFGVSGRVFNVWDYYFLYDFGGSGVEVSTISSAYVQYNGLGAVQIRLGAFAPYASLEDSEGAADPLFIEKAAVVEIARGVAAADGRMALAATIAKPKYFASVAYTGARVGQSGFFDEQQGLVGRLAVAPWNSDGKALVLGVNGSYVFDTADSAAGPGAASTGINFQNSPELRVDDTGTTGASLNLVSTGNINAQSATQWGVDGGAAWKNFYGEGGYFGFAADRRGTGLAGADPDFSGWYAQAAWVLTGEPRRYDVASASFRSPRATNPINGSLGGFGAVELAARYSTIDLNYRKGLSGAATPAGGIRGGEMNIWTVGFNWYLNDALRMILQYQHDEIERLTATGANGGQDLDAVALRLQVQL